MKPTNLNFTSGVLLTFVPVVFLVEEQSIGASEARKLALAGTPVQADRTSIFFGVNLMFVGVMNFSQVQKIRFNVVNVFWSNFNQFLVILIRSSELASFIMRTNFSCEFWNEIFVKWSC